jgi:hypothetical protein
MTSTEQQAAIDDALMDAATNPKSLTTEGLTVVRQNIADIVAADKHLAKKRVSGLGIRIGRITPACPGL